MVLSRLWSNLIFNKTTIAKRGCSDGVGKSLGKIRLLLSQIVQILFLRLLDTTPVLATIA
jgi:hypothetical protein